MFKPIENLDIHLIQWMDAHIHNFLLDQVMPWITCLGNNAILWIITGVLLLTIRKYRKAGLMIFATIILYTVLGEVILKPIIQRPRPFIDMPNLHLLIPKPASFSFPSGHAAGAFAICSILAKLFRKFGILFFILAAAIALSRVYLHVHYPSDIIAGAFLGLGCAEIVWRLSKKLHIWETE